MGFAAGVPRLRRFVGVDTTAAALAVAAADAALFAAGCAVEYIQRDMLEFIKGCPAESFDVILSSFAIHHLPTPAKAELLREAARCLRPGGRVLWTDVYNCVPGSTRDEAVLGRWRRKILEEYEGLTGEERAEIFAHVSKYDLPEEAAAMQALLAGAGLRGARCAYEDGFYVAVWVASKES